MDFPAQSLLHAVLDYDEATGVFTRKIGGKGRPKVGSIAGGKNAEGYLYIRVNNKQYTGHRLAWMYVYGEYPDGDIDHINGDRCDNRIDNLRVVPRYMNLQNQRKKRNGANGLLGVKKTGHKWEARIVVNGSSQYLGLFKSDVEAHEAYLSAKRQHHVGCTI